MNSNLSKKQISKNIENKIGLSVSTSSKILEDLIDIFKILIKEGNLSIKNIGTFKLLSKNSRLGRNPKTKEEFLISARKSISFKASEKLLRNINI